MLDKMDVEPVAQFQLTYDDLELIRTALLMLRLEASGEHINVLLAEIECALVALEDYDMADDTPSNPLPTGPMPLATAEWLEGKQGGSDDRD